MGGRIKALSPLIWRAVNITVLILLISLFSACTNPLSSVIDKDEQEHIAGNAPVISIFSLTSKTPTNNPHITFSLAGDDNITGWIVNESSEAPDPVKDKWADTAPAEYTFSPVPGVRTLYAWAKNKGGLVNTPVSLKVTLKETAPTANIASGSVITGHEEIVLTFSETMDESSISFGGTIGSAAGSLSKGVLEGDTLTISASSLWTEGNGEVLTVDCKNKYGLPIETFTLYYDVFHGVCVSNTSGNDNNTGTVLSPLKTIQKGIDIAVIKHSSSSQVRVAGGVIPYSAEGPVAQLSAGISLYGGYSTDNWKVQDTANNETFIVDTTTTGGGQTAPNSAIYCDSSITSTTVISGFTITMGKGTYNAAIRCEGSPKIENNKIIGRESGDEGPYQYGIYIRGANALPLITGNNINPGYALSVSYAVYIILDAVPSVKNNTVNDGGG